MKKLLCRHGSFVTPPPIGRGRDPTSDWLTGQGLSRRRPISEGFTSRANIHRWNAGEERLRTVECGGDVGLREADDDGARGARTSRSRGLSAFSFAAFASLGPSLPPNSHFFCLLFHPLFLRPTLLFTFLTFSLDVLMLSLWASSLFFFCPSLLFLGYFSFNFITSL